LDEFALGLQDSNLLSFYERNALFCPYVLYALFHQPYRAVFTERIMTACTVGAFHFILTVFRNCICTGVRIHFQIYHFGKPSDFVFNGSVYDLNVLLSMLLPEVSAVTEPLNISYDVPVNTRTRISCTSALGEMHPVGLMKRLLSDGNTTKLL